MADDKANKIDSPPPADLDPPTRVARHVQPVGPRVLVRIVKSPDRSESGLYLPQGVKEADAQAFLGEVVEVARTMPTFPDHDSDRERDQEDDADRGADLGANVSGIPLGSQILFPRERGVAVPWDESLRILDVRHVLAIVDIVPEDELQ